MTEYDSTTDDESHRVRAALSASVEKVYTIERGYVDENLYIQAIEDEHGWECSCGEAFSGRKAAKNHLRTTEDDQEEA